MERVFLKAPAKVNLYLEVRGKRGDGYHDLRMFTVPISLFDELVVERLPEPGRIEVSSHGDEAVRGGEDNLCYRAARYYLDMSQVQGGVRVQIRKGVPVGAGLGGGSSDAAGTILALERLYGLAISAEAKRAAAYQVGADVPFFFARSPAWVEGIGEVVRPCPGFSPLWLVVVHPGIFLSTAEVFSRFNIRLTSPDQLPTITQFSFQGFVDGLRNDLQPAAIGLAPVVSEVLEVLAAAGAHGRLMSGSGSAVLGLFPSAVGASEAARVVRNEPRARGWRVEVVHTLPPGAFPFADRWDPNWGVDKW